MRQKIIHFIAVVFFAPLFYGYLALRQRGVNKARKYLEGKGVFVIAPKRMGSWADKGKGELAVQIGMSEECGWGYEVTLKRTSEKSMVDGPMSFDVLAEYRMVWAGDGNDKWRQYHFSISVPQMTMGAVMFATREAVKTAKIVDVDRKREVL